MKECICTLSKGLITLLCISFLASFTGCSEAPIEDKEEVVRPVRYTVITSGDSQFSRAFSGTAKSGKESSLSFKVAGTVEKIAVNVGDSVKANTLLATLNKTDLQVDLEAARSNLKTTEADKKGAETSVNTTRSNYSRIEKLYESDNVSLSEFEQARGDFETAQAQLQAAESQITTAKTKLQAAMNQLDYTALHAPFDGIVNTIAIEENEEVSPGTSILTLSGLSNLEVIVNLSDLYISKVKKGMMTQVTFPSLTSAHFEGLITEIPYATTDSPTYPVTIAIPSGDERLRPGMTAEVLFQFSGPGKETELYLPVDAVGEDDKGNFVFILDTADNKKGTARKRHVSIGTLTEKGFLVKEGVSSGEFVATSGLQILLDGMGVSLMKDPASEW